MSSWYDPSFVGADDDLAGDIELVGADDDFSGDFELVGDDDIGRAMRRRRRRFSSPVEQYRTQRGRALVDRTPTRDRRLVIGAAINFAPAAGPGTVQIPPQVPFRIERIVASITGADVLNNYLVDDIIVGTRSQLAGSGGGGILADVFAPNGVGVTFEFDAASLGTLIQVRASKLTATTAATTLRLTLIGLSLVP